MRKIKYKYEINMTNISFNSSRLVELSSFNNNFVLVT